MELLLAGAVFIAAHLAPTPAEQPKQQPDVGAQYADTWAWCEGRFPYRDDLKNACRWGAYEMVPAADTKEA